MKFIFYITIITFSFSCDVKKSTEEISSDSNRLIETKVTRNGKIWSLDWSPEDQFIACGNASGLLRIYNAKNLKLTNILTGFESTINGIHWSPDGKTIVACGGNDDPRIILWDLHKKTTVIIEDHQRQIRSIRWSPKGKYFASSSHDGTIRIWTPQGKFVKMFTGANGGCVGIDWLNEDQIAASCWDNTIRTYTISNTDSLIIENGDHRRKAVLSIDWHPNGEILASGDYGNEEDTIHSVKIWDNKGQLITEMNSHEKEIRSLSWNKEGDILASGGETIRLWSREGELLKIFNENMSPVWSLDWNKKGDQLVSGHNDGKIRFWDIDGKLLNKLDGHSSEISSISFRKDSTQLFLGFSDGTLRFFNLENLTSREVIAHKRSANNITWSPDQKRIALGSNDGTCSIWKIANGVLSNNPTYFGKELYARDIAWNADSKSVAYLDYDNNISVYSSNGEFQYTVNTDEQNPNTIVWKEGKVTATQTKRITPEMNAKILVKIKDENFTLVPLANNKLALINDKNEITHGDKNDFIEIIREENGFTSLKSLK